MAASDGFLETPAVARLAGLARSTLDYWLRTGLVQASVRGPSGRRVTRRWTVADAVEVRALKELRDAGCPVRTLLIAKQRLASDWSPSVRGKTLYWDGHDLLKIGPWDQVESLVRQPGQTTLRLVALPLDAWVRETVAQVVKLDERQQTEQPSSPPRTRPKRDARSGVGRETA